MLKWIGLLIFTGMAGVTLATTPPANVTGYACANGGVSLQWDKDVSHTRWFIFFNNTQDSTPIVAQVIDDGSGHYQYVTYGLTSVPTYVRIKASNGIGQISDFSNSLTITSLSGAPCSIPSPTPMVIKVTQGSPWTISGSVSTAGNVSLNAGTSIIGNVGVTNTVQVTPLGAYFGVSVFSGVEGISVTASEGGLWGVSLTSVTNGVSITVNNAAVNPIPVTVLSGVYLTQGPMNKNSYIGTSGTTTIYGSGPDFLYSATVFPSTLPSVTITMFDGSITRCTLSGVAAREYIWTRGMAFTTNMTVLINSGAGYDGSISLESFP